MFSTVTVLAVTRDDEIVRCIRAMSFTVYQCDRMEEVLDRMDDGDILYIDAVERGRTDLNLTLLSRWTRSTKKPICLTRRSLTREEIRSYRIQGVWDVCERWEDGIAELQAIFRRYGSIMLDLQKITWLETAQNVSSKRIRKLRNAVIGLAILVAAIGGVEILPKLANYLPIF